MAVLRLPGMSGTREWVYPQSISGTFTSLRRWTFLLLHVALFVAPWVTVKGHPLILMDLPHRRVHLMGAVFTPADTIFLVLLLLFMAFSLFFFTAIFGRIWCGYACPQTVFLESWIRPLELWIEGDRTQRKRRDGGAFSWDWTWRKGAKWMAFMAVSLLLGMAMTSLFAGARPLWTGQASGMSYTFVAIFAAFWFVDFTWFREQFCIYLCPYARFQSALTDDETLLISYDEARGEPRGTKRGPEGGCIACQKCVVVCPQGIDIREGFQLECIQCARCVDACESVMSRFDQQTLVRYSSIAADEGKTARPFRPRTMVYGALLTTLTAAALVLLLGRVPFEASVNRAPGSLYTVDADGWVRNTYLLRLTNKSGTGQSVGYEVVLDGLDEGELSMPELTVASEQSMTVPLVIRLPAEAASQRTIPFTVRIQAPGAELLLPTTFKTGVSTGGEG
ncbi:MAG TPA: cytochrome c oxidase accessory protein CcoG [Longimicrobiales bacterium]|nr:cytochrome c oxidase accessory protein CcoG [Longimicrobiales bacterium]